ncbi:unnamed protein product [Hermetia illucens]|uniref:Lipase domain-containing protein n=1 Tax=Hermetia illucens TaxID=343691 RepID=A0A7R8YNA3_HERIL|nr:pancreatic triacylglycerol lipase-like [Hermetia illucens]CAD7079338.1 unnamed protein product [Hermetia illucens]
MKVVFGLVVIGVSAILASPIDYDPEEWVLIPDSDYNMHLVNLSDVTFKKALAERSDFAMNFYLYTKKNSVTAQQIATGDASALRASNFDPKNPTRFIAHGWRQSHTSDMNADIRNQYLTRGAFNVFVVGWSAGSNTFDYVKAAANTMTAGKKLAAFIDFVVANGNLNTGDTYLIGHSLGAHVVGIGGKHVTKGKINTIFGLDAALPMFSINQPSKRLATGDALYVESIHTDGGALGFEEPIGNASFYPNYGNDQPGCGFDLTTGCSHSRSCTYFAESLSLPNEFLAAKCSGYSEITGKDCSIRGATTARMGGQPSNYGRGVEGVYYLPVNSKYPYATGSV